MSRLNIQKVKPELETIIQSFYSGNFYLDHFLKSKAAKDNSIGKTYLFLTDDSKKLIGYYNITVGSMDVIDKGNHTKIGGCIHINCFAIDKQFQRKIQSITPENVKIYISDLLIQDCLKRIEDIRKEYVGVAFVTLNSTEQGMWLYKRNDFEPLEEDMFFSIEESDIDCTKMYLPLELEN